MDFRYDTVKKLVLTVVLLALVAVCVFLVLGDDSNYSDATDQFKAERLTANGLEQVTITASEKPYLVVYHTASWCPPSERFSPLLAEFYRTADRSKFQLIIKSYDNTEEQMTGELRRYGMDCPVIPYGTAVEWAIPPSEIGLPNLVIIDTRTRKVVDQRYYRGLFGLKNVGPDVPLETLRKIAGR